MSLLESMHLPSIASTFPYQLSFSQLFLSNGLRSPHLFFKLDTACKPTALRTSWFLPPSLDLSDSFCCDIQRFTHIHWGQVSAACISWLLMCIPRDYSQQVDTELHLCIPLKNQYMYISELRVVSKTCMGSVNDPCTIRACT